MAVIFDIVLLEASQFFLFKRCILKRFFSVCSIFRNNFANHESQFAAGHPGPILKHIIISIIDLFEVNQAILVVCLTVNQTAISISQFKCVLTCF